MTGDALQWFGIGLSVILFVVGLLFAPKLWRNRQSQKVDRGGTGIQAGGNVTVSGPDPKSDTDE